MSAPPRKVRAVLFDLGGTLVDERDYAGWADLARRVYLDLDADSVVHFFGEVERELDAAPLGVDREAGHVEFWRRVLSRSAGRELSTELATKYVRFLRESEPPVRLFSDVRRCLDQLRGERRKLGIVSNSTSEASVRRMLDRVGIVDYFDRVVSSGTEGVAKPDPEIFRRAVRRLDVAPAEAVYVGNLPATDAKAASAAGLHGVWLNRDGFGFGEDPPEITSLLEVHLVVGQVEGRVPRGPASPRI
ncbi:MAG TPA: HAD family hydrolase [Thermoplasmata archaeon]|nr:HAD family hydrolase [Thermoplasmata archaeon]